MAQNQHYVPQFYLRRFSENGKTINIFNLDREKFLNGPISKQCAKTNFYGSAEVERVFSKLEGKISGTIRTLVDEKTVRITDEGYLDLLAYVLWQYGRTRSAGDELLRQANELFDSLKEDFASSKRAKKMGLTLDDFNKVKLDHKNPTLEMTYHTITSAPLLMDLQIGLLVNESDVEYITSDAPVVLFNMFFNHMPKVSQTGVASKGLQVFFPLSPRVMLVMYDPMYYDFSLDGELTHKIVNPGDIILLNGLQLLFARNNVYFEDYNEEVIKSQYRGIKSTRGKESLIESLGIRPHEQGFAELVRYTTLNPVFDMSSLSFVKTNPEAESTPGIRNPKLFEIHRKHIKRREFRIKMKRLVANWLHAIWNEVRKNPVKSVAVGFLAIVIIPAFAKALLDFSWLTMLGYIVACVYGFAKILDDPYRMVEWGVGYTIGSVVTPLIVSSLWPEVAKGTVESLFAATIILYVIIRLYLAARDLKRR